MPKVPATVSTGLGPKLGFAPAMLPYDLGSRALADETMAACREEANTVVCGALEALFERTGVKPKEVTAI